jgi:hypothetical protein
LTTYNGKDTLNLGRIGKGVLFIFYLFLFFRITLSLVSPFAYSFIKNEQSWNEASAKYERFSKSIENFRYSQKVRYKGIDPNSSTSSIISPQSNIM